MCKLPGILNCSLLITHAWPTYPNWFGVILMSISHEDFLHGLVLVTGVIVHVLFYSHLQQSTPVYIFRFIHIFTRVHLCCAHLVWFTFSTEYTCVHISFYSHFQQSTPVYTFHFTHVFNRVHLCCAHFSLFTLVEYTLLTKWCPLPPPTNCI